MLSNLVSRKMQKVKKKIAMEKRRENKTVSNLEGEKKGQTWRCGSGINALQGGGERCAYVRTDIKGVD